MNFIYFSFIVDVLLILNSSNDFVKSELINGFQKLIASFTNETKATFEVLPSNISIYILIYVVDFRSCIRKI